MKKRYKTHNLDEAVFLILKGLKYKIGYYDPITAEFSFESSSIQERYRKEFYTKCGKINIQSWLSVRTQVKHECKALGRIPKKVKKTRVVKTNATDKKLPALSSSYYFLDDRGTPTHAVYGTKLEHRERFDKGNYFLTKEEAFNSIR